MPATVTAAPVHSASASLRRRHPAFGGLWSAGAAYFIGNAMQAMAASWLMVELTGSSFLAALVQTAVFLPMFLLSLPAGVLADTTDRRRLILCALGCRPAAAWCWPRCCSPAWAGPATLLFFTFVAGCCTALLSPAWNSDVADTVPREDLPQAITAMSIACNGARALGPRSRAWCSPWRRRLGVRARRGQRAGDDAGDAPLAAAAAPADAPAGRALVGRHARAGCAMRGTRRSILAQLLRTVAYSAAARRCGRCCRSSAQRQLGLGAAGFGLLMGCLGTGAVAAGLVLGRVRARSGWSGWSPLGCLVFAAVMLVAAFVRSPWGCSWPWRSAAPPGWR